MFFFILPRTVKFVATSDAAAAAADAAAAAIAVASWNIMFTVIKSLRVSIIRIYFPINFSDMILITVSSILRTETALLAMLTFVNCIHASNIDKHKLTVRYY